MTSLLQEPQASSGDIALDALRARRQQRITDAKATYKRLLAVAAAGPLGAGDAAELDGAIDALGITIDTMDGDIAAVRKRAKLEAAIVQLGEELRVANKATNDDEAENAKLREQKTAIEAKLLKAHVKFESSRMRRGGLDASRRLAIEQLENLKKSCPIAFGEEHAPAPARAGHPGFKQHQKKREHAGVG